MSGLRALCALALLVGGCGGPAASSSGDSLAAQLAWVEGQATPDGCIVATAEDITRESGFTITKITPILSGQPGCGWYDADGLVFSIRVHTRATGQPAWDAAVEQGAVALDGIGDQAIWIERAWNLWFWQGDTLVMTSVGRIGDTPARLDLAKRLGSFIADVSPFWGGAGPPHWGDRRDVTYSPQVRSRTLADSVRTPTGCGA